MSVVVIEKLDKTHISAMDEDYAGIFMESHGNPKYLLYTEGR